MLAPFSAFRSEGARVTPTLPSKSVRSARASLTGFRDGSVRPPRSSSWRRLSERQAILSELGRDAGVAVGDLGDRVFNRAAEHHRDFGRGELVILLQPLAHPGGRGAKRVLQRAAEADGS